MGIKRLNYTHLTPEQRRKGAAEARDRLRGAMMNPALTPDQAAYLKKESDKIDSWEKCTLECADEGHTH